MVRAISVSFTHTDTGDALPVLATVGLSDRPNEIISAQRRALQVCLRLFDPCSPYDSIPRRLPHRSSNV